MAIDDTHAYIVEGDGLAILDVSNPRMFQRFSHLSLLEGTGKLQLVGKLIYALQPTTVQIIDVSNPAGPALRGSFALPNTTTDRATDLEVIGDRAYITTTTCRHGFCVVGALTIFDVSVPVIPRQLGRYETFAPVTAIDVAGDFAYVTTGTCNQYGCSNTRLLIIEVRTPTTPTLHGSLAIGYTHDLQIVDTLAYLVPPLQIIDVSDPDHPALLGSLVLAGGIGTTHIQVVSNLAFVVCQTLGLWIIDVSDPANPVVRYGLDSTEKSGTFPVVRGGMNAAGNIGTFSFQVMDNLMYMTKSDRMLILDVSNPDHPQYLRAYLPPVSCSDVQVMANRAYVACEELQIIDVSDPALPQLLGRYVGSAHDLQIIGDLAYVTGSDTGMQIIDVSNPISPTLLNNPSSSEQSGSSIAVVGNRAYLGISIGADNPRNELQIFDVSDPVSPTLLGSFTTPETIRDIQVVGDLAYVAVGGHGVLIIDVSDPAYPALRGSYPGAGYVQDIEVLGSLAYVAGNFTGLLIIDVSDPSTPRLRSSYLPPIQVVNNVAVVNNLAYLTDGIERVQIVDVTDPDRPALRGVFDAHGSGLRISTAGDLFYITGSSAGLQILRVHPEHLGLFEALLPLVRR